jgi:hypothetical protein
MRGLTLMAIGVVGAVCATAGVAGAQQSDEEWISRCRDRERWGDENRAAHCEVRVSRLTRPASGTALSVDGRRNGGVSVRGVSGDSLVVHARIQTTARTQAAADAAASRIVVHTDGNKVYADGPDASDDTQWVVTYDIYAPTALDLDLETQNGPVAVRGVRGTIRLSAQNGPIAIHGAGGDVRARATNGPLSVHLTGARWEGTGLDAETHNGPVSLSVPDGYSAALETGTQNGPMVTDIAVTVQGRISRRINATLGSGGAPVRAVTTNGPVSIRRGS